jgi:hypothetical protein
MDGLDKLTQELFVIVIILLFVFLLADLSTSAVAVCEGCKPVPVINLLPALG